MRLTVIGVALPQGSKSAFKTKTGRVVVTDGKKSGSLREWRAAVGACARLWLSQHGMPAPLDGPVKLSVTFFMPRPKSAPKRVTRPATKPDLDKLVRAVGDALTGIAYTEDSRIVELRATKEFAVDASPRAEIHIEAA
jgi:Holliday junction resolvase RusA-like endonuclease